MAYFMHRKRRESFRTPALVLPLVLLQNELDASHEVGSALTFNVEPCAEDLERSLPQSKRRL